MVIESTRKGNSLFDEMKSRAFDLYMMERQTAYETYIAGDKLAEALDISEDDYNLNLLKLDELANLAGELENVRRQFIKQKLYIEKMDISETQKIEAILTSACILKNFGVYLINRNTSQEDVYLLARAMRGIKPSEYSFYQSVIVNNVDQLVGLLREVDNSTINSAKQYVKAENN